MKKTSLLALAVIVSLAITSGSHAVLVLWDDQDPAGGNMALTATTEVAESIPDTGRGDIGAYDANTGGQWQNYNAGTQDWSAHAGKEFTFSVDIYMTQAALDATDDNIYWTVKYDGVQANDDAGGFQNLADTFDVNGNRVGVTCPHG